MNRLLTFALTLAPFAAAHATAPAYSNDFEARSTAGFSRGTILTAPSGERFLGGFGPNNSTTLTLSGLGTHTGVTLSFSLYAIGSLDGGPPGALLAGGSGDYFKVTYIGTAPETSAYNEAFANFGNGNTQTYPAINSSPATGAARVNALKYSTFPNSGNNVQDAEYALSLTIPDTSPTLALRFYDASNEGASNEFYGIDNVVVSLNGVPASIDPGALPIPEPSSVALLALGLLGTVLSRRPRPTTRPSTRR